jgi:hypothetical protein
MGFPNTSSAAANEGSIAHELADTALNNGAPAHQCIGKTLPKYPAHVITDEMADYVQQYMDYVTSLGGVQMYEQRVDYSEWVGDGFGTSDAIVYVEETKTLHVVDLKYGQGHRVDAENNPQGLLYGLGAYSDYSFIYDIQRIVITIHQPRLDHVDEWAVSVDDLLKWGEWVSGKALECDSPDAKRTAGDAQCLFCKAKANCGALARVTEETVLKFFDDESQTPPDTLNDAQLTAAMQRKKLIVGWLDAVENHIKQRLTDGAPFEGYKLVTGRNRRDWIDAHDAETVLNSLIGDERYETKLLSPAKAEKKVPKANRAALGELIKSIAGSPALAPVEDKRPAINLSLADFD